MARKKWKITYQGSKEIDTFTSEAKCYEFVRALTRSYAADREGVARRITVWVDEGSRWRRFENLDLAELVGVQQALAQVSRKDGATERPTTRRRSSERVPPVPTLRFSACPAASCSARSDPRAPPPGPYPAAS